LDWRRARARNAMAAAAAAAARRWDRAGTVEREEPSTLGEW
jgi:hypothetical protein